MTKQQIEAMRQVLASRPNDGQAQVAVQECQDKAWCAGFTQKEGKHRE